MKITKTQLREIIRETILNEDEYDHWRDYKAGLISRETYNQLIKDFQRTTKSVHPYAKWQSLKNQHGTTRIYLDIPFKDKDVFKKRYFSILWDRDKRNWYMEIPKTRVKFSAELLPLINKRLTDNKDLKFVSNL